MERPRREENLNVLTHAVGTLLSVIATVLMLARVDRLNDGLLWFVCVLYGITLIGVYFN